jgi:hypothetical protein
VPHLLRNRTSIFKVISERPVILTSECRAIGEGAIATYFKCILSVTRPARAGLELTTSRMLRENTTTGLPQPVPLYLRINSICTLFKIMDSQLNGHLQVHVSFFYRNNCCFRGRRYIGSVTKRPHAACSG